MTTKHKHVYKNAAQRDEYVQRAVHTYYALEAIDRMYPAPRYLEENERTYHEVMAVLDSEAMSNKEKIAALCGIKERIEKR